MAALSWSVTIFFLYISLTSFVNGAKNTLCPSQHLKNGKTLVSSNNRFELGFFDASYSNQEDSWYLGIWYSGIKPLTVVWVANRMKPLSGIGIKLVINHVGNLILHDSKNLIYLTRTNQPFLKHSLVLLDSGNLVIIEDCNNSSGIRYVWQSFDSPSDTLLPGMKLGWNLMGNHVLTSWRMSKDPFPGEFMFRIESQELPQLLLEKNSVPQSRWGPWDGQRFSGTNAMKDNPVFRPVYHYSPEGLDVYFTFVMLDALVLLRLVVTSNGAVQFLKWKNSSSIWVPMVTLNRDICDRYGACGPYGICHAEDPNCRCLSGFRANSPKDWGRLDNSDGCTRKYALNCSSDGFVKFGGVKLPNNFTIKLNLSIQKCGDYCLKECKCMAYANVDVYGNGNKCVVWLGNLVDIRDSSQSGDVLYIRMAHAELDSIYHSKKIENIIEISCLLLAAIWFIALICCFVSRIRSASKEANKQELENRESGQVQTDDQDIPMFNICTISAATKYFSPDNKIGQGGFGPVYMGELPNGQKIAVKRLSESSNQGLPEFKNEVTLIAQLQHRNLVKLLGCCIEGEEKMLIYEYMSNKSLDQIIFDAARKRLLNWEKRFNILKGIAKGLDYLHCGSRLRIIHRDLKASNILLDDEMNPKISDFGLARNFENEREAITRRVIGTHGYMSPEYVRDGYYSTKSDVYSFGVLAIETISGQRNWGFQHPDHEFNLLGHAWKLWMEGTDMELKDPVLEEESIENEMTRCIQIGLLCVQHNSEERPTMSQVVGMLENENVGLLDPQEPGFFSRTRSAREFGSSFIGWNHDDTVNGLTITTLEARP